MISLEILQDAVRLTDFDVVAAQSRMAPLRRQMRPAEGVTPRQAGVLLLTFPTADGMNLVLTRRTEHLRAHSGQISFPGGRYSPEDESLMATALRETCEELGVCTGDVHILGMLSTIYVPPSNFEVHPTVGALESVPVFRPNPHEVAEVLTFPLSLLLDDRAKAAEDWNFQGTIYSVPFYWIKGHKVWGATAAMLGELEGRLRAVVPPAMLLDP
jgi:8-oxo-dGTP pyrophosphatase MutT (NUDIX family)